MLAPAVEASKRSRSLVYPDTIIQGFLNLKQMFALSLRPLRGFAQSLRQLTFPALPVPNCTTLRRRARSLQIVLPALRTGEPLHLIVDSTWRKVHLGMDTKTDQICAALRTHQDVGSGETLPDLFEQIPFGTPMIDVVGDGACNTKACVGESADHVKPP
ncbi:hypothetical protein D8B22_00010 [Verminephrobacter aporrectodeae subsp. tuberculatae]|nr:hypothetical protein [Verminephrobacter aporrectodeae subsp. tuberculatae]MCW8167563.1 hypothetical protein [Verminephrobacter aporrectodeae subsp. tuberculatae]